MGVIGSASRRVKLGTVLQVDERGRTLLNRVRSHRFAAYDVEELEDGTLILTPMVPVSSGYKTVGDLHRFEGLVRGPRYAAEHGL